jgi:hypothetical protein
MFSQAVRSVALATTVLVLSAFAQTVRPMQFKIPFDFKVGERQLAAGTYEVTAGAGSPTLCIRNLDNKSVANIMTNAAQNSKVPEKSVLVFHKYGDTYFLNRLWLANTDAGRELPPSRLERELARNAVAGGTTTVAASKRGRQ